MKSIQVDHPPIDNSSTNKIEHPAPESELKIADSSNTSNYSHYSQAFNGNDIYSSPAFIKRARTSYGSLFESSLDSFTESDGTVQGKGRKRARLSLTWGYECPSPSSSEGENLEQPVKPVEQMKSPQSPVIIDQNVQTCGGDPVEKMDLVEPSSGDVAKNGNCLDSISTEPSSEKQSDTPSNLISKTDNDKNLLPYASDQTPTEDTNKVPKKSPERSLWSLSDHSQISLSSIKNNLPPCSDKELVETDKIMEEFKCSLATSASRNDSRRDNNLIIENNREKSEPSTPILERKSSDIVTECSHSCAFGTEAITNLGFLDPSNNKQSQRPQFISSFSLPTFSDSDDNHLITKSEDKKFSSIALKDISQGLESDSKFNSIDLNSKLHSDQQKDIPFLDSDSTVTRVNLEHNHILSTTSSPSSFRQNKISGSSSAPSSRSPSAGFGDMNHKNIVENTSEYNVEELTQEKSDISRCLTPTEIVGRFLNSSQTHDGGNGDSDGREEDLYHQYSNSETQDCYSDEENVKRNSDPESMSDSSQYDEESDGDENGSSSSYDVEKISYLTKGSPTVIDLISDEEELSDPGLASYAYNSNPKQLEINDEGSEEDDINEVDLLPYREEATTETRTTQDSSRRSSTHQDDVTVRDCNQDNIKDFSIQEHEDVGLNHSLPSSASTRENFPASEEVSDNIPILQNSISQSPHTENERACSPDKKKSREEILIAEKPLTICAEPEKIDRSPALNKPVHSSAVNTENGMPSENEYQRAVDLESSMSDSENTVESCQDNINSNLKISSIPEDSHSTILTDTIKFRLRGHDPSIQVAISSPNSPSKTRTSIVDMKLKLGRILRTELSEFTALKNLRHHPNQKLDVLAIVTSLPFQPKRMRSGPKDYLMTFNITDHTIAPSGVVLVQIFRSCQQALPEVEIGNGILLHNFQKISEKSKSILKSKSDEASSWKIYKDSEGPEGPEVTTSQVEHGAKEDKYISQLKAWFSKLDTEKLMKMAIVNERSVGGKKGST